MTMSVHAGRLFVVLMVAGTIVWPRAAAASQQDDLAAAAAAQRAAIAKVSFLVGDWQGEGWIAMGPGGRKRFRGHEHVESHLGGLVLTLEGKHESLDEGQVGQVVHEAFATLAWDDKAGQYRLRARTGDGQLGDFEGMVDDGAFTWTLPLPNARIRYTIRLDAAGRWVESGERSADGTTWQPFFSMTLTRQP